MGQRNCDPFDHDLLPAVVSAASSCRENPSVQVTALAV